MCSPWRRFGPSHRLSRAGALPIVPRASLHRKCWGLARQAPSPARPAGRVAGAPVAWASHAGSTRNGNARLTRSVVCRLIRARNYWGLAGRGSSVQHALPCATKCLGRGAAQDAQTCEVSRQATVTSEASCPLGSSPGWGRKPHRRAASLLQHFSRKPTTRLGPLLSQCSRLLYLDKDRGHWDSPRCRGHDGRVRRHRDRWT